MDGRVTVAEGEEVKGRELEQSTCLSGAETGQLTN